MATRLLDYEIPEDAAVLANMANRTDRIEYALDFDICQLCQICLIKLAGWVIYGGEFPHIRYEGEDRLAKPRQCPCEHCVAARAAETPELASD